MRGYYPWIILLLRHGTFAQQPTYLTSTIMAMPGYPDPDNSTIAGY